jgi:hypothetical protein
MSNVLDIDNVTSVIHRRCQSHGVTLTWSTSAHTASTNGKNITLPVIHQPVTKNAMDKLHGFVIHECGHHARPEAFDILNAVPNLSPELGALMNIIEDDGMEREIAMDYAGDAVALGTMNSVILGEIADEWIKHKDTEATEEEVAPQAVCAIGQLSRTEWDGMSTASKAKYFAAMNPAATKLTTDLVNEGWVDRFRATTNPHETWDAACDLYKRLFPGKDEDELEEQREQGHSKQRPEPGENDEGGEGQANGDKLEDGEGKGAPSEGTIVSWKDAVLSEHNEWEPKDEDAPPGTIGIDWKDYTQGDVCLMPQKDVVVYDLKDNQYKTDNNDWCNVGSPESFMCDNAEAAIFGNQIRRYIQAKSKTRVVKEKQHGRLDTSQLFKLGMPPIDGGDWNKKVFYSFTDKQELDTCIMVLTDWSGSMMGQKMVQAADASGRLVHVFDRILRVPVQLAAFTDSRTPCDIGLIKAFGDRSISPQKIADRFSKFYKFSSANNDADALMWAYRQILARKESRKLLIVLSDGCPAGSYSYGSSHANLVKVAGDIEKGKRVELYGVGIQSDAVEEYYTNHKVIDDPKEINRVLFDIIKEGVK